jgi:hypothetical protein
MRITPSVCLVLATVTQLAHAQPSEPIPVDDPFPDLPPVDQGEPVEEEPLPEEQPQPTPEVPGRSGVRGTVLDKDTGEPIAGVVVETVDGKVRAVTDSLGRYELKLPAGTYTLRVAGDFYQRRRVGGIIVRRADFARVDARLSAEESEVVIVLAPPDTASDAVQVVRRRKRATVSDAISAEQISRSPDSSASDAAKRMVAATIQDGRYVIIRGLGGRYSLTLLNGVPLPSPDPDVPAAPLDLFPAALLANLTVIKTASPDMPANFAGGALSIETRSFPSKFTLKLRSGTTLNTFSTFRDYHRYEGGGLDVLGYDDGTRALPDTIPRSELAGATPAEADAQARSFQNIWNIDQGTTAPNGSLGLTMGDTLKLRRQTLGYFASVNYGHGFNVRRAHIAKVGESDGDGGFMPSTLQLDDEQGVRTAAVGGLLTAGWVPQPGHQINMVSLYTHSADIGASSVTGYDANESTIDRSRLRFLERGMTFSQLVGEHALLGGRAVLGWQGSAAWVAQHEPDTRDLLRTQVGTPGEERWIIDRGSGSSERLYSDLGELTLGAGSDVTVPFDELKFKLGGSILHTDRSYQSRRFHFDVFGDDQFMDPEDAFDPDNAGSSMFMRESTLPTDGYQATRRVSAGFAMADLAMLDPLRVLAGVRFEQAELDVGLDSDIDLGVPDEEPYSRTDRDILPSVNVVYGLTKAMNLRAAYGMTVARPHFREIAPALYYDYVRRRAIGGNPELEETRIHNADVRWETFLADTELIAASLFYKRFVHPIEQILVEAGSGDNIGFENGSHADVYGVELEARKSVGPFAIGGNLSLIKSKISVNGANRQLQGQSPYVANLTLGYERKPLGLQCDLLFNSFGRRVEETTSFGVPVYEEAFHRLDFTVSKKLPRNVRMKLAAANLLNSRVRRTQQGVEVFAYPVGVSFAASLEMTVE